MAAHSTALLFTGLLAVTLVVPAAAQDCTPGNLFTLPTNVPMDGYCVEVAVADFNGDGRPDFASANHVANNVTIRLNLPAGIQSMPSHTMSAPSNIVAGDFNEDGKADLAVTTFEPSVRILLGNGNGTFAPATPHGVLAEPRGLVTGDFNEDGVTDIAVASNQGMCVLIGVGNSGVGNGDFAPRVVYNATGIWGVTSADVDSDGITDLLAVGVQTSALHLLRGLGSGGVGNGTFDNSSLVMTVGNQREIISADFNGDGIADLATAGSGCNVLIGQGSGGGGNGQFTFTQLLSGSFNGVVSDDFDHDGKLDLAFTDSPNSRVSVLPGNGAGGFASPQFYACESGPVGITKGDLNGDTATDLLVANTGNNSVSILTSRCGPIPPAPPVISGFTPPGGTVGQPVTITGAQLDDVTLVEFHNGVPATIVSQSYTSLQTIVPAGAVSGPIRVTNPQGSATSTQPFIVGPPPVITDAQPRAAKRGAQVLITGDSFTGANGVFFGGTTGATFTVESDEHITATVNAAATTGPIRVTTPTGEVTSSFTFTVLPPDTAPRIAAVRDVPSDQGGRVVIEWLRSDLDDDAIRQITGYRVWRRAPAGAAGARAFSTERMQTLEPGPDGALTTVFWEALVTLPAAYIEGYAYVAPTTQDSLESGNPYTAFFVQALTSNQFVFYSSAVDSGYSVDNVSPASPAPFLAVSGPAGGVTLHWGASGAPDLFGYRIHRGTHQSFEPGADNLLSAQPDTGYFDPQGMAGHFYKLAAVDVHGNRSLYALAAPDRPVSTLASLASAEAEPDRIRLTWDLSANPGVLATIYRRVGSAPWTRVTEAVPDGLARIVHVDTDVTPGQRYGYRLGIMDAGTEVFAGEAWVVPAFAPGIASVHPNPAAGAFDVRFTLGTGAPASLELLDISGRRVMSHALNGTSGRQSVRFDPPSALRAGIYLVRLTQGPSRATAKVAIVN